MASNGPESIDHQTRQLQAIDATMEFAKHQTTFAAILVGLSITLNKDLIPVEEEQSLNVLSWSWYVLLVSNPIGLRHPRRYRESFGKR